MLTTASSYLVNYQAGASWILHVSAVCGNQTASNWIPLTILKDRAVVSAPLNFCADPGSIPTAQLIRTTDANNALLAGPASIVSLSGYFVDVP